MAFSKTSPIGDERHDYLLAQICVLLCDIVGAKKGASKPRSADAFTLEDFLLWKPPVKPMTDKELMMNLFGHRVVKRKA